MSIEKEILPHVPRLGTLKNGNPAFDLSTLPCCTAMSKQRGDRCRQRAMKGKKVCYYHGGKSAGAPEGNKFALTHGNYTKEAQQERKKISQLIRNAKKTLGHLR